VSFFKKKVKANPINAKQVAMKKAYLNPMTFAFDDSF